MRNRPIIQSSLFGPVALLDKNPFAPKKPITRDTTPHGVLALDIATKTGWCTNDKSGMWDFTPKEKDHHAMRFFKFREELHDIIESEKIKIVVYESPLIFNSQKRRPNFIGFKMMGILEMYCFDSRIHVREFPSATIKKFATGKGNALKEAMVEACIKAYNITPSDHNEADAVHLYHLAIQELELT